MTNHSGGSGGSGGQGGVTGRGNGKAPTISPEDPMDRLASSNTASSSR